MNATPATIDAPTQNPPAPAWLRARRVAAGTSLVASPLFLVAGFLVMPTTASDPQTALGMIATHATRWYLFGVLQLLSYLLLVPATLGLIHLAGRCPAWANLGGALAVLGAITAVADIRLWVFAQQQMADSAADRPQMVALIHRLDTAMSASLPFVLGSLALLTGTIALAAGLFRSRAVPPATCAALAAGTIGVFAAWAASSRPALIITSVLLLIGYGRIGAGVLRQPDNAWAHTRPVH